MATSRELKNKIRSIKNTKKITRTMEMISTAKARVCQKRIEAAQPYGDKLAEMLHDLKAAGADASAEVSRFPLLRVPEKSTREALFVITANRGLCGGYNTNVLRVAEKRIDQRVQEGVKVAVHMIGKKGISRFRYLKREVAAKYTEFDDKPTFAQAEEAIVPALAQFERGEVDAVTLVFMHYENASRQYPVERVLLPIPAAELAKGGEEQGRVDFIFEPSPEQILDTLLPLSLKTQFFQALVEATTCEQIARRIAMKNATDNADEMVRVYKQLYNRTRQSGITQEILEVIGGAESLA